MSKGERTCGCGTCDLEVGDVVCLKSGGPDMTVGILGDHLVFCCWFTEDECYGEEWFPRRTLVRAEE